MPKPIRCLSLALIVWASSALAQPNPEAPGDPLPSWDTAPSTVLHAASPGPIYGPDTDWKRLVDETWGPSPWTVSEMLDAFDWFWDRIDREFACFQGIDVDWAALRARYRPEIEAGVSRGRFAAIMNHLSMALREPHTKLYDFGVNRFANLAPGVPIFVIGFYGSIPRFGAALTPLPDSSLLVYTAMPDHPLGLVPGDIVLGYEGIPWKRIFPQLLAAELPIAGGNWGGSPTSFVHTMLTGAGANWHLFETIDVVKFATGDTLHLPVAPLATATTPVPVFEQLPVPGVPMPRGVDWVSWGVVENKNVGYVYVRAWAADAAAQFMYALDSLLVYEHVDGLIFDFRTNYGGNMKLAYEGLGRLFGPGLTYTVTFDARCSPGGHFDMCPSSDAGYYAIQGRAFADYDKPIAVLVGPGAISSGDQVANLFRYHPRTRTFGKTTSTAFNSPTFPTFPLPNWYVAYAVADAYDVNHPGDYLTHDEFPVDEPVWFTPASVAQGKDDVVEAALRWIDSATATLVARFDAVAGERGVELRWSFGSPERVGRVEVERASAKEGPWSALALDVRHDADGATAFDASAAVGRTYYYRLNIVLADGSRSIVGPVSSAAELAITASGLEPSPNPTSGPLRVDFAVARAGPVAVSVVDLAGREVGSLMHGVRTPGRYWLQWDGRDRAGERVPAGVYFLRMAAADRAVVRKFAIVR